jgi:hypothetical protein
LAERPPDASFGLNLFADSFGLVALSQQINADALPKDIGVASFLGDTTARTELTAPVRAKSTD